MDKTIYKTTIICVLFSIYGCKKEKTNFEKPMYYIESIESIKDSINKFNSYEKELLVCSYSEDSTYGVLILEVPDIPYFIKTPNYDYKTIKNIDILFVDNSSLVGLSEADKYKLINNKVIGDNYKKIKHLISKKKIAYGYMNTNYPYYKFIFCKKNIKSIICIDNLMESNAIFNAIEKNKQYDESIFYPNCTSDSVRFQLTEVF